MEVLLPQAGRRPSVIPTVSLLVPPGASWFIAGQVGWDAQKFQIPAEAAPQFDQALQNSCSAGRRGGRPEHICRITVLLVTSPPPGGTAAPARSGSA